MRVFQKHCVEMVGGSRNHSLAKKPNCLLEKHCRQLLILGRLWGQGCTGLWVWASEKDAALGAITTFVSESDSSALMRPVLLLYDEGHLEMCAHECV